MSASDLIRKIESHQAIVGVIGLGYVGLPLVLRFGQVGFRVIGFDVDTRKIEQLNSGESYIRHIPGDRIAVLREQGHFEATSDFARLAEPDCLLICVPTPLTGKREPDMQYIESTTEAVAQCLRPGQMVSLPNSLERLLPHPAKPCAVPLWQETTCIRSSERSSHPPKEPFPLSRHNPGSSLDACDRQSTP